MKRIKDPSRFVVLRKRCDQCPFSKNQTTVNEARRTEIILELHHSNRPFICHKAIVQGLDLVCRGFYDEEPNLVVRLAQMLKIVEYADLPGKATPQMRRRATLRGSHE